MVTNTEEEIDRDWVLKVLKEHNPHVEAIDDSIADFRFKGPEWALCAPAYARGVIPLGDEGLVQFR